MRSSSHLLLAEMKRGEGLIQLLRAALSTSFLPRRSPGKGLLQLLRRTAPPACCWPRRGQSRRSEALKRDSLTSYEQILLHAAGQDRARIGTPPAPPTSSYSYLLLAETKPRRGTPPVPPTRSSCLLLAVMKSRRRTPPAPFMRSSSYLLVAEMKPREGLLQLLYTAPPACCCPRLSPGERLPQLLIPAAGRDKALDRDSSSFSYAQVLPPTAGQDEAPERESSSFSYAQLLQRTAPPTRSSSYLLLAKIKS